VRARDADGRAAGIGAEWRRFAILAELAESDREAIAEEFEELVLERGARLQGEGEEGGSLWLLLEGRVRVRSERHAICADLDAGEIFGAFALAGGPRRASAETLSRSRLLRLTRDGLGRIAASEPGAAQRLLESIGREAARRAEAAIAARRDLGVDPEAHGD
jgi:CRP-like cAMP-binding protein